MGTAPRVARPLTRREARFNTWLSVALLAGVVVVGNLLAADRLNLRRDLSEDQLFSVSAATQRLLGGLEDRLQVRTYFTRDTELGDVQLGRARIDAQLQEFRALARGRMEIVDFDPALSTTARSEAQRAGVRPQRESRSRGTETIDEDVWLGLTLRYRGREQAVPFAQPWRFEVQFASALHALLRERRIVVGFFGAPFTAPAATGQATGSATGSAGASAQAGWPTFGSVAQALSRSKDVRELTGLAEGLPVPSDVDVVIAVASDWVHPRAVFELDQFVQRGGRLIVAVDDPVFNWITGYPRAATPASPMASELGRFLRTIGADVRAQHVWDSEWATTHRVLTRGSGGEPTAALVRSPAVITLQAAGLSQVLPPTRDLRQVTFWWAHPIVDAARFPAPSGVRREDLAWVSPGGRLAGVLGSVPSDGRVIADINGSVAGDPGAAYILASAFSGALPSAYVGRPTPGARDPLSAQPGGTVAVNAAPLPAGATPGSVVVVGDADWLRDAAAAQSVGVLMPFEQAGGALLLENLVDWLTLDEDLIELRSRVPRERPLVDFVKEARVTVGLLDRPDPYTTERERMQRDAQEDEALRLARLRRWWTLLAPIGAALTVVGLFGAFWNWRERHVRRGGVR
ncbi:MAG: Gldg family protein [Planctomycetota bacterium]